MHFITLLLLIFPLVLTQDSPEFIDVNGITYIRQDVSSEFSELIETTNNLQEKLTEFENNFEVLEDEARSFIKDLQNQANNFKKIFENITLFIIIEIISVSIISTFIVIYKLKLK